MPGCCFGLLILVVSSCGTQGPTLRATTADELALPSGYADRLMEEAGLDLEPATGETDVKVDVAEELDDKFQETAYADSVPDDHETQHYLVQVPYTEQNRAAGLQPGLEWIVVVPNLDIPVGGPVGTDGEPAEGAVIHTGYVFVDPASGDVDLTHWSSE